MSSHREAISNATTVPRLLYAGMLAAMAYSLPALLGLVLYGLLVHR